MTRLVEDRALLENFKRGDPAALAEVYREYVRPLYSMLSGGFSFESRSNHLRFKGFAEPWAKEEAVQEIFTRAFTPGARMAYDGIHPYRNYLFTIARNYVVDRLRVTDREIASELNFDEPDSDQPLLLNGINSSSSPPDEILGSDELAQHCKSFFAALTSEERDLFNARFRDGLSIEETARLIGISEHHVKRGEQKLKKRFFVQMKEHGYFEGYRLGRVGIEKALAILVLFVGASGAGQ